MNSRSATLANLPDSYKNIDTTRKTSIFQETMEEEEKGELDMDEWLEKIRFQEALQEEEYSRENTSTEEAAEYINDNANEWETLDDTEFGEFMENIGKPQLSLK